jgi:hypothetical protein
MLYGLLKVNIGTSQGVNKNTIQKMDGKRVLLQVVIKKPIQKEDTHENTNHKGVSMKINNNQTKSRKILIIRELV